MDETIAKIRDRIRESITAAAATQIDGEAKREQVVREISVWADDHLRWPNTPAGMIAEALDGPVINAFVHALVDAEYRHLVATGAIVDGG